MLKFQVNLANLDFNIEISWSSTRSDYNCQIIIPSLSYDWLAALQAANQKPCMKFFLINVKIPS